MNFDISPHSEYMRIALELAADASDDGDVPVGCIIVDSVGRVIGRGRNRREHSRDATAHAEVEAIRDACAAIGSWRLEDATMYVTLEPCAMCAGAIINARIPRVYYGAREDKTGACGSVINIFEERFGHRPALRGGLLEDECARVLSSFFERIRQGAQKS